MDVIEPGNAVKGLCRAHWHLGEDRKDFLESWFFLRQMPLQAGEGTGVRNSR